MEFAKRWNMEDARQRFALLVTDVQYRGDRVVITRYGRKAAALVSIRDLDLLWQMEVDRRVAARCGPNATKAELEAAREFIEMGLEDLVPGPVSPGIP